MTKIINNTTKIYLSLLRIQQVISVMEVDIMTYIHDFAQKGVFLICKFTYDTIHTLHMKQIEWSGNLIQFHSERSRHKNRIQEAFLKVQFKGSISCIHPLRWRMPHAFINMFCWTSFISTSTWRFSIDMTKIIDHLNLKTILQES